MQSEVRDCTSKKKKKLKLFDGVSMEMQN